MWLTRTERVKVRVCSGNKTNFELAATTYSYVHRVPELRSPKMLICRIGLTLLTLRDAELLENSGKAGKLSVSCLRKASSSKATTARTKTHSCDLRLLLTELGRFCWRFTVCNAFFCAACFAVALLLWLFLIVVADILMSKPGSFMEERDRVKDSKLVGQ
jgi:hypothetical protein